MHWEILTFFDKIIAIFNKFIRKEWPFLLILILSVFIRSYRTDLIVSWDGDVSRDVLMAKHIFDNGELVKSGPQIDGGYGFLANSFWYYYLLATLWAFTGSAESFFLLISLLGVSLVVFAYLIGRIILSRKCSLGVALMVAVSFWFGRGSIAQLQPFIMQIFLTISIFYLIKFWKENRLRDLYVFIFFLVWTLHLHYSVLWLFFILSVYGGGTYWIRYRKGVYKNKGVLGPLFLYLLMILGWVWSTYIKFPFDQIFLFRLFAKNSGGGIMVFISGLARNFSLKVGDHMGMGSGCLLIFFILIYVGMFCLVFNDIKSKKNNLWVSSLFLSMISGVIFCGLFKTPSGYYFSCYYVIWLISLFYVLGRLFFRIFILRLTALIVVLYFLFSMMDIEKWKLGSGDDFSRGRDIADKIFFDLNNHQKDDVFDVISYDKYVQIDHFGATPYWYFLEKKIGKNLVKIVNSKRENGAYFEVVGKPKRVYFICKEISWSSWDSYKTCPVGMSSKYQPKKEDLDLIGFEKDLLVNYMLYVYYIDDDPDGL